MESDHYIDENEKERSLNKYEERLRFWTEQSLNQVGYSLNVFLSIELAFLAYLISQRNDFPKLHIDFNESISWKLVSYYTIIVLLFIAILICSSAILTRLYDLRITRHLAIVRKRCLKIFTKYLPENYLDIDHLKPITSFKKALLGKIKFVHFKTDTTYESIIPPFQELRTHAKKLGDFTWFTHNLQLGFLLVATLIFGFTVL